MIRNRFCKPIVLASSLLTLAVALNANGQPGPVTPAALRAEQSPLDEPLGWLNEARRSYALVKDYSCTMMSKERVRGELLEENIIQVKAKTQPFSIHMRWLGPKKYVGQEVAFVMGKHNNKMRVKSNFLGAKILGFMTIDAQDPRVTEHSRHTILEAGIGNMIESTHRMWTVERTIGKAMSKSADYMCNQKECHRIEMTRGERNQASYCFRTVLYLEKQSKLPIRLENYDWPRQGGPAEGELLEMFSYVNLQFNTGLKDEDFNK